MWGSYINLFCVWFGIYAGFFFGAKVEDIKKGNLYSFLAWAMHSECFENLNEVEHATIAAVSDRMASILGVKFLDGHNPQVEHIKMTLNPIEYVHRPLLLYIGSAVKNVVGDFLLQLSGFSRASLRAVTYWHKGSQSKESPMLFFHGISTGWIFYYFLIVNLAGSRPVVLIDLDTIKINSLVFDMPDENVFVDSVKDICALHFGANATVSVVGHSFGTILAAWLLRAHPTLISHLTLLDPVSLLLGLPDVAFNFLHKAPDRFSAGLIRLMASRELTVSHMLHRHFWWYNNILWLEDLPTNLNLVIGLSGQDEITNPKVIMEYVKIFQESNAHEHDLAVHAIKRTGEISILYWPHGTHASMLFDTQAQRDISKAIALSEQTV